MKLATAALALMLLPSLALAGTPSITSGPYRDGASVVLKISCTAAAAGQIDTTATIFLRDVAWPASSTANEYACFVAGVQTAGDSVAVSVDWSIDGTSWGAQALFNATLSGSALAYGGSGQDKYPRYARVRLTNNDSTAHDYAITLVFPRACY